MASLSPASAARRPYRLFDADELNRAALEHFVYQPVTKDMVAYLADAAYNVIACDAHLAPPPPATAPARHALTLPTPPRSPDRAPAHALAQPGPPSLDEFITKLVTSSNVQVPSLMSTLVYLNRLKSKLQPMARGLRCTTYRIFLASLILAAKYLNDSSPKNKHWANYTHISNDLYSFGFNRTEVNLMEKQLLFLEWDLRITEQDLYRELDGFLEPFRIRILARQARRIRQREEKRLQQEIYAAGGYPSPASSLGDAGSRQASLDCAPAHAPSRASIPPPALCSYASSASSYAPSIASSRQHSRSTSSRVRRRYSCRRRPGEDEPSPGCRQGPGKGRQCGRQPTEAAGYAAEEYAHRIMRRLRRAARRP